MITVVIVRTRITLRSYCQICKSLSIYKILGILEHCLTQANEKIDY